MRMMNFSPAQSGSMAMPRRNTPIALLVLLACMALAATAFADPTIHTLKWKHFDGTNAADAVLRLDHTWLGKGQAAIDALYKQIAAMPAGDQINVSQGVQTSPGVRQFPFNLMQLIKIAQQHGVIVNVPPVNAPQ